MRFVQHGAGQRHPGLAGDGRARPQLGRKVQHLGLGHAWRVVVRVGHGIQHGCTGSRLPQVVALQRQVLRGPLERARKGIKQQFGRVETLAVRGLIRSMRTQPIQLTGLQTAHKTVPDTVAVRGQADASSLLRTMFVKQTQLNRLGVAGIDSEVDAAVAVKRHAGGAQRPGLPGFTRQAGPVRKGICIAGQHEVKAWLMEIGLPIYACRARDASQTSNSTGRPSRDVPMKKYW